MGRGSNDGVLISAMLVSFVLDERSRSRASDSMSAKHVPRDGANGGASEFTVVLARQRVGYGRSRGRRGRRNTTRRIGILVMAAAARANAEGRHSEKNSGI
jgi:hypothetical protein